eukprot:UN04970
MPIFKPRQISTLLRYCTVATATGTVPTLRY